MKKYKIVLIDDDVSQAEFLKSELGAAGFDVYFTPQGERGIHLASTYKPDAVLLNPFLDKTYSFAVLEKLKSSSDTKSIPVIILSKYGLDEDIKKSIQAGADDYIATSQHAGSEIIEKVKDFLAQEHHPALESSGIQRRTQERKNWLKRIIQMFRSKIFGISEDTAVHVLFIDDDEAVTRLFGSFLATAGFKVLYARFGSEGRELARRFHPRVILLDALLPKDKVLGDAIDIVRRLKDELGTAQIPIVLFTSGDLSPEAEKIAQELGVADYIHKSIDPQEFMKRVKKTMEQ